MFDHGWDNWVSDFDGAFASETLPTAVQGRTTEILEAFGQAVRRLDPGFPDEVRPGTFSQVFSQTQFNLPDDVLPHVPETVATFLEYLQDSGRVGEGYAWAVEIRGIARTYSGRIKPTGGLKGTTIKRSDKVSPLGRNDPCPCGSGKKYKKCCMRE